MNITQVGGKKHDPEIVEKVDPVCQNDLLLIEELTQDL